MNNNFLPQDQRSGFLLSGHWHVDHIKMIDRYPQEESLGVIFAEDRANGGGAFNVAKDLSKMKVNLPIEGIGFFGDDEDGRWALAECKNLGIDTKQIKILANTPTSYTDVYSVKSTGKRTFFTSKGACAQLNSSAFDFSLSQARIFYLGYLGMLDTLDSLCPQEKIPQTATVLRRATDVGMITAADLVSVDGDFVSLVNPCLPHIDYFFANEIEAERLTGVVTTGKQGTALEAALIEAGQKIIVKGVRQACILHVSSGAVAVTKQGDIIKQGSVQAKVETIKGTNGCGDAFASGVLYGIHQNFELKAALELGACIAGQCLLGTSSSESIIDWQICLEQGRKLGFKKSF